MGPKRFAEVRDVALELGPALGRKGRLDRIAALQQGADVDPLVAVEVAGLGRRKAIADSRLSCFKIRL